MVYNDKIVIDMIIIIPMLFNRKCRNIYSIITGCMVQQNHSPQFHFVAPIPAIRKPVAALVEGNTLSAPASELRLGANFLGAILLVLSSFTVGPTVTYPRSGYTVVGGALEL